MKELILCYLVKPTERSRFWKMRYRLPGEAKETQKSLKIRDKRAAERVRDEFIREQERIHAGISPTREACEAASASVETLIRAHIDDLRAQHCAADHVTNRGILLRKMTKEIEWKLVRDIKPDSFIAWRAGNSHLASRTLNNYLAEIRTFLNWLEKSGRMTSNPLAGIQKVKVHTKARQRRAISDEEIGALLEVAPPQRAIIYALALHTGLRRREIELLEWQDLHLDVEDPFIRLRAATTKNRMGGDVFVHPQLKQLLLKHRTDDARPSSRVVKMFFGLDPFKADLKAAGIPFIDENGVRFDFHAMRKTFNTRMAVHNVPIREAKEAMRHSDSKLTLGVYTDASKLNVARQVNGLPPLPLSRQVSVRVSCENELPRIMTTFCDTVAALVGVKQPFESQRSSHSLALADTLRIDWGKHSLTRVRT